MASETRHVEDMDSSFEESDSSFLDDSSFESDWTPDNMMSPKKTKRKPLGQKATVESFAVSSFSFTDELSTALCSSAILDRIQKCIARGKHPNTPEEEAKTSLRMAAKLMAQHNIHQTEIHADDIGDMKTGQNQGGKSVVAITAIGNRKRVVRQGFTASLARAMKKLFDCESYRATKPDSIKWTFYGIPENTASAAMAFETTHNLILEWARDKKGNSATHSYCMGVAEGLLEMARREKKREKTEAGVTPKESQARDDDANVNVASWTSQKQLALFRNTALQTAEAFLRENNIKVHRKIRRSKARDMKAWKSGKEDSKKIDVRRRMVE